jgi:hypothetical protein
VLRVSSIIVTGQFALAMVLAVGGLAIAVWFVTYVRLRNRRSNTSAHDNAVRPGEKFGSRQNPCTVSLSNNSSEPLDSDEEDALEGSVNALEMPSSARATNSSSSVLRAEDHSAQVSSSDFVELESVQGGASERAGDGVPPQVGLSVIDSGSTAQQVDLKNVNTPPEEAGSRTLTVEFDSKLGTDSAIEKEHIEVSLEPWSETSFQCEDRQLNSEPMVEVTSSMVDEVEIPESLGQSLVTADSQSEEIEQGPDDSHSQIGEEADSESAPARYRAPQRTQPKSRTKKPSESQSSQREQVLEVRVQALLGRHGFCKFRVLAHCPPGAPVQLEARIAQRTTFLSEVGDDWYEIPELSGMSLFLQNGMTFSISADEDRRWSWELRGRDLYVLAGMHGLSGFISTTRLCLGREQIVLCRNNRASEVEQILAEAGCSGLQVHRTDKGSPAGWVFFTPVNPSRSVSQVPGDDILNLLRPVPDIEVRLEGGLWLRDSSWMTGYPPRVHIIGEVPLNTRVTIDGELAEENEGRLYHTRASGRPGPHIVWCSGKSASYSICEPDADWENWEAYPSSRGSICGATVMQVSSAPETLASVPTANPILIGANPGEIFRCETRPGKQWTGFVPFPVCWALPQDPLHCDRSLRRVLLITPISPVHTVMSRTMKKRLPSSALQWCYAIRDCQRKRLAPSPDDVASGQLWKEYTREAKTVWRTTR